MIVRAATSPRLLFVAPRRAQRAVALAHKTAILTQACAGSALLFFAPLFVAIAIAVKLTSPGPVFFTQYRYGHRNHRFLIYKFRTMHAHMSDRLGVKQTVAKDPRVTFVGKILRRTNLDELPQLINVILGDMSLVGPRPHVPGMQAASTLYESLVPDYFQRHISALA